MASFNRRLKNILVGTTLLDTGRAEEAMVTCGASGRSFSDEVLDRGWVSEGDLVSAIAQEIGLAPIDLTRLTPDEAILGVLPQDLAQHYGVFPVARIGNQLTLAVSNPFDILKLDDVKIVTGCEIQPVVATERAIRKAIDESYDKNQKAMEAFLDEHVSPEIELTDTEAMADDENFLANDENSPVIKIVNMLIVKAVKEKASDIHIEPFEKRVRVRFRQDGVLREITPAPPKRLQNAMVSRVKIMSELDIAERRVPQDGKFQIKLEGRQVDFRVSILPTVFGEKVVLRILDATNLTYELASLGFETECLTLFQEAIHAPYGMVLVTGPTGSGKSTTLYSAVREILTVEDNLVTVEDPVEYQLEGVNQVPVNVKRGLTFSAALRSILRQDPDIVMIGEIRDQETIEIAVKAALTGHLVLSTLHTNDAPSTLSRMIDMGVDPFMVASSVLLICAQRLVRRLCPQCKEPLGELPQGRIVQLGFKPEQLEGATIYKPAGCKRCSDSGYKGRLALLETLPMTEMVKRLVIDGKSAIEVKNRALKEGMVTLRQAGLRNILRGNTSIEEVLSASAAD